MKATDGSPGEEETDTSDRESLIREAQIVQAPVIVDDFRFWTVARKYGFAKEDLHIREAIPEDTSAPETTSPEEGVRAIGYLKQDGLVYILKEEENGWLYVESGTVRGFIRKRMKSAQGKRRRSFWRPISRRQSRRQRRWGRNTAVLRSRRP